MWAAWHQLAASAGGGGTLLGGVAAFVGQGAPGDRVAFAVGRAGGVGGGGVDAEQVPVDLDHGDGRQVAGGVAVAGAGGAGDGHGAGDGGDLGGHGG
jgi:hypothetical protein